MADLFKNAAYAMLKLMVTGTPGKPLQRMKLSITAQDAGALMVDWLSEILYLFEGGKMVVQYIAIDAFSPSSLDATLEATPFTTEQHEIIHEIKAVTYHQIEVGEKNGRWEARVYFDL